MTAPFSPYQFAIRDIVNFIVDEYARKHKPGAGQLGLFEKPEERQKPLFSKKVDDEAGKWVTMRGARVFISGDDGRIMKGPKRLMGKTREQIEREGSAGKGEGENAPKPKPLSELGKIKGGRADNRQKKLFEELNPGFKFEEDEDVKTVAPAAVVAPSSPADEEQEPTFTLDSTPQSFPAKPPALVNPDPANKQGALFDTGKNTKDLKGQELLFNSDAGDLANPKTMENRWKHVPEKPVEYGDIVTTNDGVTGTLRGGSGGLGSDRVRVVDSDGHAHHESKENLRHATDEEKAGKQFPEQADSNPVSKFRPDVDLKNVLTPAGQLKASSRTGANAPWTYQGTIDLVHMNAADQTINGQHYPASDHAKKSSAIVRAAAEAGYKLRNFRAGSRGTVWAYVKGDKILTQRGADLLLSGGGMTDFDAGTGREDAHDAIKKFSSFAESLGDSTPTLGSLSAALNRSPLGEHLRIQRTDNGEIRLSAKNGSWHVYEGTQEHSGGKTTQHESSMERFLSKLKNMAETEIPDGYGGWAQHDRAAEAATFKNKPSAEEEGPQDGDTNADGLVFRDGRWHRTEEEQPAPEAPSSPAEPEPKSESSFSGSFDPEKHGDYKSLLQLSRKIDSGELSFEEFQQAHKFYTENKEPFVADLQKRYDAKTLRNIAGNMGDWRAIRNENKKPENAVSVYTAMLQRAFNVGEGISNTYSYEDIKGEGGMDGAAVRRLSAHVAKQTPESLAAHVEKEAKNVAEYAEAKKANEEAAADPKTLKDFDLAIKSAGGYEKLNPEQQSTYDDLMSEKTRSGREEVKKPTVVEAKVSGDHGGFELTKNYHSKRGQDIFTASPKNRVERDEYDKMNTAAKRLGGWYYKPFGGTPGGFHFPDEDKRNRFLQAMAGESVDRSDILGAKQEEREKTVGEKLADHAERLEERASASYSAERKENTNKRAGQAASARASAEHDLNQAVRLRSISEAMAKNETKHLRGLSALTHLESLQRVWKQAQRKHEEQKLQEKYGDEWRSKAKHDEREHTYQAGVNPDSIATARIPRQIIYPSNVQRFLEQAANTPGLKQESAKWQKLFKRHTNDEKESLTLSKQSSKEWFDFANRAKSKGVKHDWGGFGEKDDFQRLYAMGIQEDHELRAALRELAPHQSSKNSKVQHDPVKELEKKIHREHKAEGFYPTPPRVIDRLMEHADIRDGQSVLEPSAGSGRIMDAVKAAHGDSVSLKGIEHHSSLQDLLKMKGHEVEHGDFLEHKGEYDRIVMNPPFENDAAIDHVKHAFSLLKPGGKLVAVVPGGDRMYRKAGRNKRKEFSDFVDEHGEFEELPESSFAGSDAPRQTGVNTSLVILKKPGDSGAEKYSRLHIYEAMNGVIDRYVRPESEGANFVQIDKYAHPLIHAAVGAGVMALANKAFKHGPMRSVAHAAIGAAMAAWMSSAMAANGIQLAQGPSSPAVSAPATPGQIQKAGNNAVNQIVNNAINQHAANSQAAATAPPSAAQAAAHSVSAAAMAGVSGALPIARTKQPGDQPGYRNGVRIMQPLRDPEWKGPIFPPESPSGQSLGSQPAQTQSAGKGGARPLRDPGSESSGGSFNNSEHPRHPAGSSESKGGEFAPKGGAEFGGSSGESSAPEASSSPADGDSSTESPSTGSPRNYPDNLNKPASEQTNYSPPERSPEELYNDHLAKIAATKSLPSQERQSRKAAWEQTLQGAAQQITEKKETAKTEKNQAKQLAKATSFNPDELEGESSQMIDDIEPAGEAPKEDDFTSQKEYEKALEKHNRSAGAKQATIKKRANANLIPEIAGEHDLDHDTLRAAVNDEISMSLPYHKRKEEARQYISKMGWNSRRIDQAEDRGIDSSSTQFDDVASEWAGLFPEIAGSDESEWVAKMWELSKEGAQPAPSAGDEDLVRRVAKRLADFGEMAFSSPAEDAESFDPGPVSGQPGDVDYTPFSRSAVIGLMVDKYMRIAGVI